MMLQGIVTVQNNSIHQYKVVTLKEKSCCKICYKFCKIDRRSSIYCLTCKENEKTDMIVCKDHLGYCVAYFDPSLATTIPEPVLANTGRRAKA